jgi:hypothetical protein
MTQNTSLVEEDLLSTLNKVLADSLCPLYVIKADKEFREVFGVEQNVEGIIS